MIGDLDIETVMALIEEQDVILSMPFGRHQGKLLKDLPKDYVEWLSSSGSLDTGGESSAQRSASKKKRSYGMRRIGCGYVGSALPKTVARTRA